MQCVYPRVEVPFQVLDFHLLGEAEKQARLARFLKEDAQRGFTYDRAPLMRITLIQWSATAYKMIWTYHHMLLDGWSTALLFGELLQHYDACCAGKPIQPLAEDAYEAYIRYINQRESWQEEAFWKAYFEGWGGAVPLPQIKVVSERNRASGTIASTDLAFDAPLTDRVSGFNKAHRITVNTLVQGVWSLLLSRYTGMSDVVTGVTVAGRPSEWDAAQQGLGLYINTIPLRVRVDQHLRLVDWLQSIQEQHTAAREYQYTSLSQIQTWQGFSGDLFDTLLVFENYPLDESLSQAYALQFINAHFKEHTNYALTIAAGLAPTLTIRFNYNQDLLTAEQIEQMAAHFQRALEQILSGGEGATVGNIDIITPQEKSRLTQTYGTALTTASTDRTIVEYFEQQVRTTPAHLALRFEYERTSYAALNTQANKVARYLRKNGVQREALVGICMDRSPEMIVAILGILKAGAAYVPIDPLHPLERIQYMVLDAGIKLVLTQATVQTAVQAFFPNDTALIAIDEAWARIAEEAGDNLGLPIQPSDLAYVIYTSGSTGRPKGVMIEHRSPVNMALDQMNTFGITEKDGVLQFASLSFDASVSEIL
ncbi:MAG TPA: condensation domain-containing protein, partial [Hymenobacter sp.]|nr:condensation domain-containing protein [Hymenobacter sp.]